MERLQRDMNQLVGGLGSRVVTPASFPAMNVWTGDDTAVITAEVPGVSADEIDISVVGETLTLSGERKPEDLEGGVRYHRRERGGGRFSRSIELPFRVDADKVEAAYDKGILRVTLPRAEADKPRKITVRAA
jgi:HSP20 family protein